MKSDFLIALTQLASERHLPKEQVLQAIEVALASAFKKDNPARVHFEAAPDAVPDVPADGTAVQAEVLEEEWPAVLNEV